MRRDGVSNHQPHHCLLNRLFRRRSKQTSKLRVTSLCAGNSPMTGEFPAQMASNAENVSIWWRHHGLIPPVPLQSTAYIVPLSIYLFGRNWSYLCMIIYVIIYIYIHIWIYLVYIMYHFSFKNTLVTNIESYRSGVIRLLYYRHNYSMLRFEFWEF